VLRNGRLVGTFGRSDLPSHDQIVRLIVGVEPSQLVRA